MLELEVEVVARKDEAEGICSFTLIAVENSTLPPYTAGAHIDVETKPGTVRQYSLCGDPEQATTWRIGVLREENSRGGSQFMHDNVQVGARLRVSTPKNHFELIDAPHSVLVAGGIGITPILAMAKKLSLQGASFEIHYCGRTESKMAFRDEIARSGFGGRSRIYINDAPKDAQFDAAAVARNAPSTSHLYVCGPAGFMDYVLGAAASADWSADRLHREHFSGVAVDTTNDGGFEVKLVKSGKNISIPAGKSVLEMLLQAGVDVNFSCENGVCGTCLTRVVEGIPDHRDTYLTVNERAANDQFTPCCSRSKTLVLAIDL
jgi:vanillate monooxygenase ferredoxin subunit